MLASRSLIAQTIQLMLSVFPRESGHGWKIPKVHGLTKFVTYMQRFGSASNFFGGIGESNHKWFLKDTRNNTQQRASNFTSQIAQRYYEKIVCDVANQALVQKNKSQYNERPISCISYPVMEGKYTLTLNINGNDFSDPIISNGKSLSVKFVEAIVHFISQHDSRSRLSNINGFTACKLQLDGREEIFRATWSYGNGGEWYDWCLIHWDGYNKSYPARILGFVDFSHPSIETNYCGTIVMAVVQSSPESSPMSMDRMSGDFVSKSPTLTS